MSSEVHVNVTGPTYAADLLDEVRAHGFSAKLLSVDDGATVAVEANGAPGGSVRDLWLTVETWLADRRFPLVPLSVDEHLLVLRPPSV